MKSKKIIQLLHRLIAEREKIESCGHEINPDLKKVYEFINKKIQELQEERFKIEFQHISDDLSDLFEDSPGITKKEKDNVIS
jgi:replicative DNA helicase